MYAEVIIDIQAEKLDKVFHYDIPVQLSKTVELGMQVVVPFGPRKINGVVVGFTSEPDVKKEKIKNLLEVKNSQPLINVQLLLLARWMSERYGNLLIDCLRAVLPMGLAGKTYDSYRLSPWVGWDDYHLLCKDDPGLGEIVKLFLTSRNQQVSYRKISNAVNDRSDLRVKLNKLKQMGLLQTQQPKRNTLKPKKERIATITVNGTSMTKEEISQVLGTAPKQLSVFTCIYKSGGTVTLTELNKQLKGASAFLKGLEEKGLVTVDTVEVFRDPLAHRHYPLSLPPQLTKEQALAVGEMLIRCKEQKHQVFLLHGVTGSGKTEVYMRMMEYVIKQGKQVIVLVPEISLTPQTVERLFGRFGSSMAILHSGLSPGERYDEWRKIRLNKVQIVVGARSAVFAPVDELGLIIVDEEHETTYKQGEGVRYHAREVAIKRAELAGCPVILGSATPSIESYYLAETGQYELHTMNYRVGKKSLPEVQVVDMREELKQGNKTIFSRALQREIAQALGAEEQIILFINRRGFSTFLLCRECGYSLTCKHCDVSLTYHMTHKRLNCHCCGYSTLAPDHCPSCGGRAIRHFGTGTQRVEEEVQQLFPQARVARLDVDTTSRKGSHEEILGKFKQGDTDILVGTQMVAKGLDFPRVGFVGVIAADIALNFPDFRAAERTFQLLTQVSGRAGRGEKRGRVVVQTYNPDHYSIIAAANHDYLSFYRQEVEVRKQLTYPPFTHLIRIIVAGRVEEGVAKVANQLALYLKSIISEQGCLLGPTPAPLPRVRERFRWHMIIKGCCIDDLTILAKTGVSWLYTNASMSGNQIVIDINPQDML